MNRLTYTIFFILFFLSLIVLVSLENGLSDLNESKVILAVRLTIIGCFIYFCAAKRLKDCAKSPFLSLLILIPVLGFFFAVYLCFPRTKIYNSQPEPETSEKKD